MSAKRIAQIGAGATGNAVYQALRTRGVAVQVFTQDGSAHSPHTTCIEDPKELAAAVSDWAPDVAVVSPGISIHSPLLENLRALAIPLISEVQLAWQLQKEGSHRGRPWICVTGTNGKTTTVGLLTHLLQTGGYNAKAVGNIGLPVIEAIDSDADIFAVELSSFQLETTDNIEPLAAICLNVKADHLDWHGSVQGYQDAKAKVYEGCKLARLYFADDPVTKQMAVSALNAADSELVPLSATSCDPARFCIEGDCLVEHHQGRTSVITPLSDVPFFVTRSRSPKLLEDIIAAVGLARIARVSISAISRGLRTFDLQPHRQQVVAQFNNVTWIDDSKATNADAALASLSELAGSKIVWVLGGDAKGQDFTELIKEVAPRLRKVILVGIDRDDLRRALLDFLPKTSIVETSMDIAGESLMDEVIQLAAQNARSGDRVILAPGCASWDQFNNYAERGDLFAAATLRYIRGRRQADG